MKQSTAEGSGALVGPADLVCRASSALAGCAHAPSRESPLCKWPGFGRARRRRRPRPPHCPPQRSEPAPPRPPPRSPRQPTSANRAATEPTPVAGTHARAVRRSLRPHARRLQARRASTAAPSTSRSNWYATNPEYLERAFGRAELYLYHIVTEIEARGMPLELALLPVVESAFEPYRLFARTRRRACGSSFPARARVSASSRTGGTTAGATSWSPRAPRSITCSTCTMNSMATGCSPSPPTTAAKTRVARAIARTIARPASPRISGA